MKTKEEYRESLKRTGVPIFPGGKVLKKDILQLPFQASGLELVDIKELELEKVPEGFISKLHLVIKGGSDGRVEEIYNKNKSVVEESLGAFAGAYTNGLVDRAALRVKSHNNENLWLDIQFYYNFEAMLCDLDLTSFCYTLVEQLK